MKLSVVMPCFNAGKYLREMLDSCLNQTFQDWELILVDDQSTDTITRNIIEEYSNKDARLKVLYRNREPKGGNTCRNIGISQARGQYLMVLDADDILSPTCFEKRVAFMEANQDCDYASFPATSFFSGNNPFSEEGKMGVFGVPTKGESLISDLLCLNYPFCVWTNIYRCSKVQNLEWDEKVSVLQDFDWMLSCCLAELRQKYASNYEIDYFYRQFNDGSNVCADFSSDVKCNSTIYLTQKTFERVSRLNNKTEKANFISFVFLQVYRILQGEKRDNAIRYIDSLKFMPIPLRNRLFRITDKILKKRTKYDSLRLSLYFMTISPKLFWKRAAYSVRDLILGYGNIYYK